MLELVATVKALLRPRMAEEAAQVSTKQWQVTFDAINDGVALLDRDGRAVQINSAMEGMLGKSWNDLSGQDIHDLLSVAPVPQDSPFLRMLGTGRREAVELRLGERWLRVTVDPIRDAGGDLKGGLCIASDITDRKRLEEAQRRRARSWQRWTGARTSFWRCSPTSSAIPLPRSPMHSRSFVSPGTTRRRRMRHSKSRVRQITHMTRLLDDLLDVSRFTRGNIQLRKIPVDLITILTQAVEEFPTLDRGHAATSCPRRTRPTPCGWTVIRPA